MSKPKLNVILISVLKQKCLNATIMAEDLPLIEKLYSIPFHPTLKFLYYNSNTNSISITSGSLAIAHALCVRAIK